MNPKQGVLASTLASLILLAPLCTKAEEAAEAKPEAVAASAAEKALVVRYGDGLLSVDIDNRPLPEVVAALAEHMPLKVYLKQSLKDEMSNITVFDKFEDRPLQDGLREILSGRNFVFKYGKAVPGEEEEAPSEQTMEIWFLGGTGAYGELTIAGDPTEIAPLPMLAKLEEGNGEQGLSTLWDDELRELAINASDAGMRSNALRNLGNRVENPDNVETFVTALEDEETDVRWTALTRILSVNQEVPTDAYRQVITSDPSPFMRKQALAVYVFKKRADATSVLQEVQTSDDPMMSAYAEELLTWLEQQAQAGGTSKHKSDPTTETQ